jgi:hypothetical protein
VDAPYRLVMNLAGFMALGVCIFAFAAAYWLLLRPSWAKLLATGLLGLAGWAWWWSDSSPATRAVSM